MKFIEALTNVLMIISILIVPVTMITFLIIWLLGGR
jgi:hypothetical protein